MDINSFFNLLNNEGFNLNDTQKDKILSYLYLVEEKNKVMDLTSNTNREEMLEKNFYDCIKSSRLIQKDINSLLDLGSGAGFPGVLYAILFDNINITLLEPMQKRCLFLKECTDKLNLDNVSISNLRAEDLIKDHRSYFDMVSARAVAKLSILLELSIPLLKVNGYLLALKGPKYYEEVKEASKAINILHVKEEYIDTFELPTNHEKRINVLLKKEEENSLKYPRLFAKIKKNPL